MSRAKQVLPSPCARAEADLARGHVPGAGAEVVAERCEWP